VVPCNPLGGKGGKSSAGNEKPDGKKKEKRPRSPFSEKKEDEQPQPRKKKKKEGKGDYIFPGFREDPPLNRQKKRKTGTKTEKRETGF